MLTQHLREIAANNGWHFEYGRSDFHNLYAADTDKEFHFFLDPVQIRSAFSKTGARQHDNYTGRFMLLKQSHLQELYDNTNPESLGKYQKNIQPVLQEMLPKIYEELNCLGYEIIEWNCTEVINLFDFNADGVLIQFNLKSEP